MRCEDLTRELASPTGAHSPAEMAGHLADCPSCAEWSRQAARFDQTWEATRPSEPTPSMMDALWASASVALEAQPAPATLRLEGLRHRRSWLKPALVLAQAAALLLAVGFVLLPRGEVPPVQVVNTPVMNLPVPTQSTQITKASPTNHLDSDEIPTFHVNVDETLLVSIPMNTEGVPEIKHLKQPWPEQSNQIPPIMPHDVMGAVEVIAEPPVVVTSL
jgi:hypothetical protein